MSLLQAKTGKWVQVTGFVGGRGLEQKLRQLGLAPGEFACVVRVAPLGGPVLVDVGGREIALGRGVASKILVEESGCASL